MSAAIEALELSYDQAHQAGTIVDLATAAAYLQDVLTQRLTAYACGLKEGRTVARWAAGETVIPRDAHERRLRLAYTVARYLAGYYGARSTRAWFMGSNPQLADRSPADTLRAGDAAACAQVAAAARAFAPGA